VPSDIVLEKPLETCVLSMTHVTLTVALLVQDGALESDAWVWFGGAALDPRLWGSYGVIG
jgi:hypothetical protein